MRFLHLAIGSCLSVLSACSPTPTSPKTEVVVYTALEDDELAVYTKLWNEDHPDIALKVVRDSTGIITAKLLAEQANPVADVIWATAASSIVFCDEKGLLEGYAPAGLDTIRPEYVDARNQPPHWVGTKLWMNCIAGNEVELKKAGLPLPRSYADLANPGYRGKVTAPNPASSGTGFMLVSGILQTLGEEAGWKCLEGMHANIAQYTHSGSKPGKLAGQGEYPIGITLDYRAVVQKKQGDPLAIAFPAEGAGWEIEVNALIRKPAIKPEAKLFLDWAIGARAMKAYGEHFRLLAAKQAESAVRDEAYPVDPFALLSKSNDFHWAAANRDRILQEWSRRFDAKSEPKR